MSTIAVKKVKLGDNADTSKNFLIEVPAVADGTLTIKRENGTNVLSIDSNGAVQFPGGFETGSFTPTVFGTTTAGVTTYTTQLGTYVRVGNLLFFEILLSWTDQTGSGNLGIGLGDLPILATTVNSAPGSVLSNGITYSGQLIAGINASAKEAELYRIDPVSGTATRLPLDTSVGVLRLTFTCIAA